MENVARRKRTWTGFGDRLLALREQAGLTQAQLAEKSDIHPIAISKYERDVTEPSWSMVLKLAEALGVTPDAFLADDK